MDIEEFETRPIDFTCKHCGTTIHHPRKDKWLEHPEIIAGGWCRFQFGRDAEKETPWFCCTDHLFEWIKEQRQQ